MQPLDGFRVLDLTHVLAGPCATHHLRCLGAEVIKVERPVSGDPMRALAAQPDLEGLPPGFRALNAGKKSVVVDLSTVEGRESVLRLAENADIFVENFRPGVAARLGLAPEHIRAIRPDIIYCSISGWGQQGTRSGHGAYDHVIQAATGMMMLQGDSDDAAPVKVGFPVIDIATGMAAAEAILAAVIRRLRGDRASITIDVSMIDAALSLMSGPAAQVVASGTAPDRVGNRGFVGSPGAETFATSDGHISVAANTKGQFTTLCRLLGQPELALPPHIPAEFADEAFLNNLATAELRATLRQAFLGVRTDALETALNAAGVPAARVRDLAEYLADIYPHTPGIGSGGDHVAFAPPFRWEREQPIDLPPAPRLDADRDLLGS